MAIYCLDTNIYIEAKNGPYGFDIAPGFWSWLDRLMQEGNLHSPTAVYEEIMSGKDDLATWVKDRKDSGLFTVPTDDVQKAFKGIADHVVQNYPPQNSQVFLGGADPWVIALAKASNFIVVSAESYDKNKGKKPKIPNVCEVFDVPCIGIYRMLRDTGARFQ
jgi:hypothetical protein